MQNLGTCFVQAASFAVVASGTWGLRFLVQVNSLALVWGFLCEIVPSGKLKSWAFLFWGLWKSQSLLKSRKCILRSAAVSCLQSLHVFLRQCFFRTKHYVVAIKTFIKSMVDCSDICGSARGFLDSLKYKNCKDSVCEKGIQKHVPW